MEGRVNWRHILMIGFALAFLGLGVVMWLSVALGPLTSPAFELGSLSLLAAIALAVLDLAMQLAESEV